MLVLFLMFTNSVAFASGKFNLQQYNSLFLQLFIGLSVVLFVLVVWEVIFQISLKSSSKKDEKDLKVKVSFSEDISESEGEDPIKALLKSQASEGNAAEKDEDLPSFLQISKGSGKDTEMDVSPVSQESDGDPFKSLLAKTVSVEEQELEKKRSKIQVEPPPPPKTGETYIKTMDEDPFKALLKSTTVKTDSSNEEKSSPLSISVKPRDKRDKAVSSETARIPAGTELEVPTLKSSKDKSESMGLKLNVKPSSSISDQDKAKTLNVSGKVPPKNSGKLFSRILDSDTKDAKSIEQNISKGVEGKHSEKKVNTELKISPTPHKESSSDNQGSEVSIKPKRLELDIRSKVVIVHKSEPITKPSSPAPSTGIKRLTLNIPGKSKNDKDQDSPSQTKILKSEEEKKQGKILDIIPGAPTQSKRIQ